MTLRQNFSGGGKFEKIVGYSRAVRAGNLIFVSGTTGFVEGGGLISDSDSYAQAKKAIENIDSTLRAIGSSISDVVRTRVFVNRQAQWQLVAKAHEEAFGTIMPASSMIVCDFLDPKIQVEIEADAMIDLHPDA